MFEREKHMRNTSGLILLLAAITTSGCATDHQTLGSADSCGHAPRMSFAWRALHMYVQFAADQHSDPNDRLARILGHLDAHYPYEKTGGVLTAADQLISDSPVSMTQEQAACWLDDCYRRHADGNQIRHPTAFLAEYSMDDVLPSGLKRTSRANQSVPRVPDEDGFVEYLRFAEKQYHDPNQVLVRFQGYLDAFYTYEKTSGSVYMLETLIASGQSYEGKLAAKLTTSAPDELAYLLNECYKILDCVPDQPSASTNPGRLEFGGSGSSHGSGLQVDGYGMGVHMNQYGQPVTLRPDLGGVPGEQLQIREDAYGPGVHMDQYGRPVREYSWPDGRRIQ